MEHSYGIIPCRRTKSGWEVYLVQLHAGHWGFPKGHPNSGETPHQTAERELLEETGLKIVKIIAEESFQEEYTFRAQGAVIEKRVTYYIAEVAGEATPCQTELKGAGWFPAEQVSGQLTFSQGKSIWNKASQFLTIN